MKKQPKKIHSREYKDLLDRMAKNMQQEALYASVAKQEKQEALAAQKIVKRGNNIVVHCINCFAQMEFSSELYCQGCENKTTKKLMALWESGRTQADIAADLKRMEREKNPKTYAEKQIEYRKKYKLKLKLAKEKNVQNQNPDK
jgi:hypothetical protein